MTERSARERDPGGSPRPPSAARLDPLAVAALLAGPLAFAIQLGALDLLLPRAYAIGSGVVDLVTALGLVVLLAGAAAALRVLRGPAGADGRLAGSHGARALALGGLLLCAFFLGVLGAEAVPRLLRFPGY